MTDFVMVGSKLPYSVILEAKAGGEVKAFLLQGAQKDRNVTAPFFMIPSQAVLLTKVPRDFWEAWVKEHKDFPAFKNGFIFAAEKKKDIFAEAKEKDGLITGLERIDPADIPKKSENTQKMETA